jgi:signal transduction histidine kinase
MSTASTTPARRGRTHAQAARSATDRARRCRPSAEALTNVVKHAHADRADVKASVADEMLHLEIRDDGIGGADPDGHGLVGLGDRLTALGGRLEVDSPAGGGTFLAATLPLSVG